MQQRGMDSNLRRAEQWAVGFAASLVAKVPAFFLAALSGVLVARTALPAVAGALSSGATPLWSASRPLYPFFVVNLIIFVIWRLSDWEQHGPTEEKPSEAGILEKVKSSGATPTEPLSRKPSPEPWKEIPAVAAVAPVKMVVPQHVDLPPASEKSVVSSELRTTIAVSEVVAKVAQEEAPTLEDAASGEVAVVDDDDENPPMEIMWKAIMEKRSRETATTSRPLTPPRGQRQQEAVAARPLPVFRGREPLMLESRDESNRLYNDFIRKNHKQLRFV